MFVSYNNGPVYEGTSTELPVSLSDVSNAPGRHCNTAMLTFLHAGAVCLQTPIIWDQLTISVDAL
jgi:hypothetical protein